MLAKDCSNYSVPFTPELVQGWRDEGFGLLILQAFPNGYAQHVIQLHQQAVCEAVGMPWDSYVYDYLAEPAWLDGALDGLSDGPLPRKVWLDEEDVSASGNALSNDGRRFAIGFSLDTADAWLEEHGRPRAGIYSAEWWWTKTGNTTQFADRELWAADYDNVADATVFSSFGGWTSCRIKQYAGSQPDGTDLNVLSTEEESELTQPAPPADCSGMIVTIADIADRLGDQLLAECQRSSVRKTIVRRIVAEMEAERTQAIGPRP